MQFLVLCKDLEFEEEEEINQSHDSPSGVPSSANRENKDKEGFYCPDSSTFRSFTVIHTADTLLCLYKDELRDQVTGSSKVIQSLYPMSFPLHLISNEI